MDFQQEYIPHDYLELHISAAHDAEGKPEYKLDPDYLHIWPRHSFMLIALPNQVCHPHICLHSYFFIIISQDKSFTCTLFAPTDMLARLSDGASASTWFHSNFPDIVALIGEDKLIADFISNPRGSLVSIKVQFLGSDSGALLADP
jgi:kynurenine 3-monooxygenase